MFSSRVTPNYPITSQPKIENINKKAWSNKTFSLSIANAHEFASHPLLQKLRTHDTLLVTEDSNNQYKVFSVNGTHLFTATEESGQIYILHICDPLGEEIITLSRDCCCLWCCGCGCRELKVFSPSENLIGTISEPVSSLIRPNYRIFDATLPDAPLYEVRGPYLTWSFLCRDVDFNVYETRQTNGGNPQIGVISKKWGGIVRELLTDWDTFGVSFPENLDVNHKALFLAACFLIDKMHFSNPAY